MEIIGDVASFAGDLAPVPGLGPAINLVIGIWKLCDNVKVNKSLCKRLRDRCRTLLYALRDADTHLAPERVRIKVDESIKLLTEIHDRMKKWAGKSFVKQFWHQGGIAKEISESQEEISDLLSTFNITNHLEGHAAAAQNRADEREEHEEMVGQMSDQGNTLEIIRQTIASNQEENRIVFAELQLTLGTLTMGTTQHTGLSVNLWRAQQASGQLLPKVELKHGEVRKMHIVYGAGSAQFDIWVGQYLSHEKCAIKVVRAFLTDDNTRRRFLREVEIWRKLWDLDKGEHFLPFWGACLEDGDYPHVVSPWMEHGDVLKYVTTYPDVDRKYLIKRIAEGVKILHSYDPPIVHGDLKSANILIDGKGNPLIADFSLSKILESCTEQPFTQSKGFSDSFRWFAPELFVPPHTQSRASDIFSFAMTVLEIMTGEKPFSHIKSSPQVLISIANGVRPRRPDGLNAALITRRGLDDDLWKLLMKCWERVPSERPDIDEVLMQLPTS